MKSGKFSAALPVLLIIWILSSCSPERGELEIFAGSACKPALDEIARGYKELTGITPAIHYGGSGSVLSQMIISKRGDVYIPGSGDFLDIARRKSAVDDKETRILAYLVPVICVQKGNPLAIRGLADLARRDVRLAIGDPRSVCLGLYAAEIIAGSELSGKIRANIRTRTESCEKTANLLAMKSVDAIIGWDVFEKWNPAAIGSVRIEKRYMKHVSFIPASLSVYTRNREGAVNFLKYLGSPESAAVFRKHGYIVDPAELKKKYGHVTIGGTYVPEDGF